jgi:hypothetical protein
MSPAPVPSAPEDQRIVAVELLVHLTELASRDLVDLRQVDELWLQVRRCDAAALDSFDPALRSRYLAIVEVRRRPRGGRPATASERARLRAEAAHARVALHRRLMLLHEVVDRAELAGGPPPIELVTPP